MATHYSLKPGCCFFPFHNGSQAQEYIVRTADDRQFRISAAARHLLESLDQGVSLEQIYAEMTAIQPELTWEKLNQVIQQYYGALLISPGGDDSSSAKPRPAQMRVILAGRFLNKDIVQKIAERASLLYAPLASIIIVTAIVLAHVWLYTSYKSIPGARGHVFVVLVATLGSIVIHEFGHASAVSRYGGKPGAIGAGLYLLLPVFFADVSQVWTFQRRHRAIVDLGGIYFQQIVFLAFATIAVLGHSPSFRAACVGIDVMTAIAINPILRFDGYWVLTDWLGITNLHKTAGTYLKRSLRSLFRWQWVSPTDLDLQLSRPKAAVFLAYALIGNPLFIVFIFWNLRWIKSTFFSLVRLSPMLFKQTMESLRSHEWIRTLDLLTALLFLFASALTLFLAAYLRGRQVAGFISARSHVFRRMQPTLAVKGIVEGRNLR